ncbi:FMN reductase [Aneurinibacillus sp. BA2021]|nr:FMN reductase [Aneurinibacillus sp. BA2021]
MPRSDSAGRRPDMTTRRIAVVSAGLSNPSSTRMLADRLAAETVKALAERDIQATVDVIELRDYAHDITNNLLTGFAPPALETAINTVVSADALIAVTPIFSTSYSGLFKSFIDVLDPDALTGKPVLIGANAGTPRHSLAIDYAIRPLFAYLHAEAVSTGVFAASSDWGGAGDDVAPLAKRVEKGARELAEAVARREAATVVDPYDPATYLGEGRSFGHMLGGLAGE